MSPSAGASRRRRLQALVRWRVARPVLVCCPAAKELDHPSRVVKVAGSDGDQRQSSNNADRPQPSQHPPVDGSADSPLTDPQRDPRNSEQDEEYDCLKDDIGDHACTSPPRGSVEFRLSELVLTSNPLRQWCHSSKAGHAQNIEKIPWVQAYLRVLVFRGKRSNDPLGKPLSAHVLSVGDRKGNKED